LKFASADPALARGLAWSENLHKIPEIWFFSSENLMKAANWCNWLACGAQQAGSAFGHSSACS
jgi:hypothetical protein